MMPVRKIPPQMYIYIYIYILHCLYTYVYTPACPFLAPYEKGVVE